MITLDQKFMTQTAKTLFMVTTKLKYNICLVFPQQLMLWSEQETIGTQSLSIWQKTMKKFKLESFKFLLMKLISSQLQNMNAKHNHLKSVSVGKAFRTILIFTFCRKKDLTFTMKISTETEDRFPKT